VKRGEVEVALESVGIKIK
jgi:hypothetical protein